MRIDRTRRFARDHRADYITDGKGLRSLLPGFALSCDRIGSLTRLRDDYREHVRRNERIAIPEFASIIDLDRNARELLDHELTGERRVPARAAGDDPDR